MTQSSHQLPIADLHTPEELLQTATDLLASSDSKLRRAVVLESITALEAYVHRTVFGILDITMDPLLVDWLKEKTLMDFDSRIGTLTSVATGHLVDKSSYLWGRYKKAKKIRNNVTHSGQRVSAADAAFVLDTVREWIAYIGSTADVSLALDLLKQYIESSNTPIPNEVTALRIVRDYFIHTKAASITTDDANGKSKADLKLIFGNHTVLVEVKLLRPGQLSTENRIKEATRQVAVERQLDLSVATIKTVG